LQGHTHSQNTKATDKSRNLSGLRVPFGLKEGRLYTPSPSEVSNGLKCQCICPECHVPLIANQPKHGKRNYFSHGSGSSCSKGYETAVHLMAKQILEDEGCVTLPTRTVFLEAPMPYGGPLTDFVQFKQHKSANFQSVVQEQSAGPLRPDLTARFHDGTTIYIEIFVTHAVEDGKAAALDNLMEIDLSSPELHRNIEDAEDLRNTLHTAVLKSAPRKWFRCSLFNNHDRVLDSQARLDASAPEEQKRREQAVELETIKYDVHRLAREIIRDESWITLPPHTVNVKAFMPDRRSRFKQVTFDSIKSTPFKSVDQEKLAGTAYPGIVARNRNGVKLHIQIDVGESQENAMGEADAAVPDNLMVLDLKHVLPEHAIGHKDLRNALREVVLESAPRSWAICSLYDNLRKVRDAQADLDAEARKAWQRHEEVGKALERRKHQPLIDQLSEAMKPEYQQKRREERWDYEEAKRMRERAFESPGQLKIQGRPVPFVGKPIKGDWIINADSLAWQAYIILVQLLSKRIGAELRVSECVSGIEMCFGVLSWMNELNRLKSEDQRKARRSFWNREQGQENTALSFLTAEQCKAIVSPATVVIRYFKYLSSPGLRVLKMSGGNGMPRFTVQENRLNTIVGDIKSQPSEPINATSEPRACYRDRDLAPGGLSWSEHQERCTAQLRIMYRESIEEIALCSYCHMPTAEINRPTCPTCREGWLERKFLTPDYVDSFPSWEETLPRRRIQ